MRLILANVRTATERRGDLNAQLAAIRIGERRLGELAERYGARVLAEGFEAILDYAERRMRNRIAELPPGTYFARGLSRRRRQQRRAGAGQAARGRDAATADARLRGLLAAAARQHQRRGADDAFGRVLRRQGAHRRDHSRQCRHPAPRRDQDPAGLVPRRAAAGCRLRRQHRDVAARLRHGAEGLRAVRAEPHSRRQPGHHEPDRRRRHRSAQRPALHLHRDHRRRPGRAARAATAWTASSAT